MNYTCRKVRAADLQQGDIFIRPRYLKTKIVLDSFVANFDTRVTTLIVLRDCGIVEEHFMSDSVLDVLL